MEVQRDLYSDLYSGANPQLYIGVPQHAYAITTATAERTTLFTCDILSSMAVTIYDKEKKIGALLHIDCDFTNTIQAIFDKLKNQGSRLDQLEVQLLGGYTDKESGFLIKNLYQSLKKEILSRTTNLVDHVFKRTKDDTSFEDILRASQDQLEDLKSKYRENIEKITYAQIALDVLTGEVTTSTNQDFLIACPWEDQAYSKEAGEWEEKIITARQKHPAYIFKILNSPLEEVYDGTQKKDA